jgi:nucleoid-associated protein YgaU
MREGGPDFGPYRQWRDAILIGLVLVCFSAVPSRAQDVAQAARQQNAAKQAEAKATPHVYTDDDLKRNVILTPQDQARVQALREQQPASTVPEIAEKQPSNDDQGASLGEIARRYRLEKAAREAELAMKNKLTPFPYEIPATALAAPAPPVGPSTAPLPTVPDFGRVKPLVPGLTTNSSPRLPCVHARISPFQPRPLTHMNFVPLNGIVVAPTAPVPPSVAHSADHVISNPAEENRSPRPLASLAQGKRVQVQPGQSWWKLAEVYLGEGSRWPELRQANEGVDRSPDLLDAGKIVVIPQALERNDVAEPGHVARPDLNSEKSITIQKGDTLWSLARKYLGRGTAWVFLAQANPQIVDFTHLAIGASLEIPSAGTANLSDPKAKKNQ